MENYKLFCPLCGLIFVSTPTNPTIAVHGKGFFGIEQQPICHNCAQKRSVTEK